MWHMPSETCQIVTSLSQHFRNVMTHHEVTPQDKSHIALLATCRDRRANQLLLWFLKQNAPSVIPAIFIALHRFCYTLYMKVRKVFFLQNFAMQCFVMCSQQFNDCQILVKPLCSRIRIYILADSRAFLFGAAPTRRQSVPQGPKE